MVLNMIEAIEIANWPLVATALIAGLTLQIWFSMPRYPNVPTLRLSKKPWIFGEWEDAQASVHNAMEQCAIGWERYSKHGVNYLLNTPIRKVLVVAPRYFKEFNSAPEDVVHTLAAQNIVCLSYR